MVSREGDLGAVVQLYEPDGLEVEFVTAALRTRALLTFTVGDVRKVQDTDFIAVRSVGTVASTGVAERRSQLHGAEH